MSLPLQSGVLGRAAIAQAEAELGEMGRVLIRASGTKPLLRVMVEARDAAQAWALAERMAKNARH